MAAPVTPVPGLVSEVATGGISVTVFPSGINGGYITNPYGASGVLYVDPVGNAGTSEGGTTFALQPGQTWKAIPGQLTPTTANAADSAHAFSAVSW